MGHQAYIPPVLVSPTRQPIPNMNNAGRPRMDESSYVTMGENSIPTMGTPDHIPYDYAFSASNSVSGFGFFEQEYQYPASTGHSYKYNWIPSPAASGYTGITSPPTTAQNSQVHELPHASAQLNTNISENNCGGYYNTGYYTGYYPRSE